MGKENEGIYLFVRSETAAQTRRCEMQANGEKPIPWDEATKIAKMNTSLCGKSRTETELEMQETHCVEKL